MCPSDPVSRVVHFGKYEVDPTAGELLKDGQRIRVQEQPFRVLLMLLGHPGEVVTREQLRLSLWPENTFVDFDTGLNKAINKLREALGDSAEHPRYIETLPRRGYRFIAPLEEALERASGEPPPPGTWLRMRRRTVWAATIVVALLVAALVFHFAGIHFGAPGPLGTHHPPPPPRIESIAVLPLENLSSDHELESFADGMTDTLITKLGEIPSARVISRQSIIRYKRSKQSLPEIAYGLKADAVVEGTVQRLGHRVRINIQLVQAGADRHLWAKTYKADSNDLLAFEEKVTEDIVHQIERAISSAQ